MMHPCRSLLAAPTAAAGAALSRLCFFPCGCMGWTTTTELGHRSTDRVNESARACGPVTSPHPPSPPPSISLRAERGCEAKGFQRVVSRRPHWQRTSHLVSQNSQRPYGLNVPVRWRWAAPPPSSTPPSRPERVSASWALTSAGVGCTAWLVWC